MAEEILYDIAMLPDIAITPEGDFQLAPLYPSIIQDLEHWLDTNKQELVWSPSYYGEIRKDISRGMTPTNLLNIRAKVIAWLNSDTRVKSVDDIKMVPDGSLHLLNITAIVDGVEIAVKLNI